MTPAPLPSNLTYDRPEPICGMSTWMPVPARILGVRRETFNTQSIRLGFLDPGFTERFRFAPGQFNMLYVPGVGEAAISISSNPARPEVLEHTIRVVGSVTRAVKQMPLGGVIGLRGPFGRPWPMQAMEQRDLVIVAGGIGLAPLRPVIYEILAQRAKYGRVVLLYGCRSPEERIFAEELEAWEAGRAIQVLVTVDNTTGDWHGPVGVVTNLLPRLRVNAERTVVLVCGPRILNRVAAWNFLQLHVPSDQVYVSLERNMNCGFGRCGHCQYGRYFVCKDGPVFAFSEVASLFAKEDI